MAGLHHPRVVCLHDYCMEVLEGTDMTEQVPVFEYIPNGDMTKLLENRECRNTFVASFIAQSEKEGESEVSPPLYRFLLLPH